MTPDQILATIAIAVVVLFALALLASRAPYRKD